MAPSIIDGLQVASAILSSKDVPYVVAAPLLIQDIDSWAKDGVAGESDCDKAPCRVSVICSSHACGMLLHQLVVLRCALGAWYPSELAVALPVLKPGQVTFTTA